MAQSGSAHPKPDGISPQQRQRLQKAKLSALVRDHSGTESIATESIATESIEVRGALTGLMFPGGTAYLLTDFGTPGAVAGAMSWALKAGSESMVMFVDFDAPLAARFARYFSRSSGSGSGMLATEVRAVQGAGSIAIEVEARTAEALSEPAPAGLLAALGDQGLEVVHEHGITRGEVLGLEVARLVTWPAETGGDGQLHLEVGVGRFDRDAVWAVNDGNDLTGALADTVAMVRQNRYPGAPPHPMQRLARERWLRAMVLENPEVIGVSTLQAVGMTIEAAGMKDAHPAGAFGVDLHGEPVVVVTSVGFDLAAVPLAADLRDALAPSARLLLAVPSVDLHPMQQQLASMLDPIAEIVAVDPPWT